MQLHEISHPKRHARRIGRGGKRGTTSGRGQKGQKSRAGHKIRPALRDLLLRIPKRRGFANLPSSPDAFVLNVGALAKGVGKGEVTVASLKALGLVPQRFRGPVKVLGSGKVAAPLAVVGLKVSDSARAKIEAAGGSVA